MTDKAKLSLDEKVRLFRKRFTCRTDSFYTKRTWETSEIDPTTNESIKVQKMNYRFQCANDGDIKICLIAQNKGKCFQCDHKVKATLDDSWVRKHINGSETLCLVPITAEGSKFGALDFDRSVEEGIKFVFEDAKSVRDFAASIGIHAYIARSSNKGFHLYMFFDNWVDPAELQSFLLYMLSQTGFVTRQTTHRMPLPEMFPKQSAFNSDSDGSGIRVPFSEPDVRKGRNCFMDDNMQAYPLDQQWEILAQCKENSVEEFQKLLVEKKVIIHSGGVGTSGPRNKKKYVKKSDGSSEETADSEDTYEKPKQRGSFWNAVAACPALKEYWARTPDGRYTWDMSNPRGLFNAARVASMNIALASLDGEEILKKRWPTEQTERQIEGAKALGYKPTTCHWMQMQSVCHVNKHPKCGTHCFKKLPPLIVVEGKIVENPDNLPESEWDSPSPARHLTDKNLSVEEIKEKLTLLSNALKARSDKDAGKEVKEIEGFVPDNPSELLEDLVKQIVKLKKKDKDSVEQHVLANKLFTKTAWSSRVKSAGGEVNDEKQATVKQEYPNFYFKQKTYTLKNSCIGCMFTNSKGELFDDVIWNFWIERIDEPATVKIVEVDGVEKFLYDDRNYHLVIHVGGQFKTIEVTNKIFANPNTFFEAVRKAGGTELKGPLSSKDDYDVLMAAISHFSKVVPERHALRDIGYYNMKGGVKYIMPGVIVTRDEIVKNDAYTVKMDTDYGRPLDFQIYGQSRFKEVSRHIIDELFNCNSRMMVMSVFSHAMASVCCKPIEQAKGWRKSPILWVCGDFGDGKTFVFENIQYFFGNFNKSGPSSAGGSYVAKIGAANMYRHVVLMLEDYKSDLEKDGGVSMKKFIQHAYDRTAQPALKRDGQMRAESARCRGLIAISGEDILEREASALSRLILVEGKYGGNTKEGGKVMKMKHLYSGFTPYVIRRLLQLDDATVLKLWNECFDAVAQGLTTEQLKVGSNRMCENFALNLFGLRAALDTMAFHGAISQEEVVSLTKEHTENLIKMRDHQMSLVSSARASNSFIDDLSSLLADPTRYHIAGHPSIDGIDIKNSRPIGIFIDKNPEVLFLDMNLAHAAVAEAAGRIKVSTKAKPHIVRQLLEDGIIVRELCEKDRNYCRRKNFLGQIQSLTPVRASALGFAPLAVVRDTSKKPVQKYPNECEIILE